MLVAAFNIPITFARFRRSASSASQQFFPPCSFVTEFYWIRYWIYCTSLLHYRHKMALFQFFRPPLLIVVQHAKAVYSSNIDVSQNYFLFQSAILKLPYHFHRNKVRFRKTLLGQHLRINHVTFIIMLNSFNKMSNPCE